MEDLGFVAFLSKLPENIVNPYWQVLENSSALSKFRIWGHELDRFARKLIHIWMSFPVIRPVMPLNSKICDWISFPYGLAHAPEIFQLVLFGRRERVSIGK